MTEKIGYNIKQVMQRLERAAQVSGRRASDVTLVAVTKMVDSDAARACLTYGVNDLGENRVQEFTRKFPAIPEARWHLIGRLQTNKVKEVVGKVCLIHSLDRWNLAEEIDRRYRQADLMAPVLLQVNISGEQQKAGIAPDDVEAFLDSVGQLKALKLKGLMTIAPQTENSEETRPIFRELCHLKNELALRRFENVEMEFLSMGMSQDFDIAIEEGANMVRVGSAIFSAAD